jgi:CRISPR system Cascade subunit CasE
MYLSRLILNPRSRQVRSELADPYEMHRTIWRAFPQGVFKVNRQDDAAAGVLFRVEVHPRTGVPTLLVQSRLKPNWSFLLGPGVNYLLPEDELPLDVENPAVKAVEVDFRTGQVLAFRLRANPTVKKDREDKKQGRRVGLFREEDQLKWLERKIGLAGGALLSARTSNEENTKGMLFVEKEDGKRMRFLSVQFDGVLQVKDPAALKQALQAGIGSGKGLGFGLLSLAPARG